MSKSLLNLGRAISSLSTFYASRAFRGNQGGRLPLYMRPNNFGQPLRYRNGNPDAVIQRRRRRRRRTGIQGLEINRAEGGYKSIVSRGKTQLRGINLYARLIVNKIGDNWVYEIAPEWNNYAGTVNVDLVDALNKSEEFLNLCQHSSQYKVLFFNTTLDYQRIPEAKDRLSRLLMTVSTDKVKVERPKLEQNVMNLSMTQPGIKNFNFRLNGRNMDPLNLAWQNAQYLYAGNVVLEVDGQDVNHMNDDSETTYILGTLKITVGVLFRLQDYEKINQPRSTKPTVESNDKKINEVAKLIKAIDEEVSSIKKEISSRYKIADECSICINQKKETKEISTQTEEQPEQLIKEVTNSITLHPIIEIEEDKKELRPAGNKKDEVIIEDITYTRRQLESEEFSQDDIEDLMYKAGLSIYEINRGFEQGTWFSMLKEATEKKEEDETEKQEDEEPYYDPSYPD